MDYIVLYGRKPLEEEVKGVMCYKKKKRFSKEKHALEFLANNLPGVCAQLYPFEAENGLTYIVAQKYTLFGFYEARRCTEDKLDTIIERASKDRYADKLYVGLEKKLWD